MSKEVRTSDRKVLQRWSRKTFELGCYDCWNLKIQEINRKGELKNGT